MIRVTIELLPGGDTERATVIAKAALANTTPTADPATYIAIIRDGDRQRVSTIEGHNRSQGVWALLRAAIDTAPLDELTTAQAAAAEALAARLSP